MGAARALRSRARGPPRAAGHLLHCFDVLAKAYLAGVEWEPRGAVEARTARLLPGLFLARVDGKSPVEYVTDEAHKEQVRRAARSLISIAPAHLAETRAAWEKELSQ